MGELYESIKRGMEEAIAHSRGNKTGVRIYRPQQVDVKVVRGKCIDNG
jgi:putative transcriptional regulator